MAISCVIYFNAAGAALLKRVWRRRPQRISCLSGDSFLTHFSHFFLLFKILPLLFSYLFPPVFSYFLPSFHHLSLLVILDYSLPTFISFHPVVLPTSFTHFHLFFAYSISSFLLPFSILNLPLSFFFSFLTSSPAPILKLSLSYFLHSFLVVQ